MADEPQRPAPGKPADCLRLTLYEPSAENHVAGPFATLEEAVAAMKLILTPPAGNA